jgi:PAS domain S-box-containing protein
MWEKVYKGEVVQGLDIPWRTKNGKKIILSVSEKSLKDAGGNSIGRVFVAKDITELRKHEEEIRNTKIREETIVNNALDLIILLDKENRWLMVNPAWEEITGFKQEELQGKITEEQPCVTQETLDATAYDRKLLAQGKIVPPFDMPLVCKDGRKIIVSATERPLKDARGRWIGSVFYGRDITELRKKEEKLRETTIDKKYFKEYSKRAIELADSWGMGEVFKHEMEEWVKKHKPRQRRKKERL